MRICCILVSALLISLVSAFASESIRDTIKLKANRPIPVELILPIQSHLNLKAPNHMVLMEESASGKKSRVQEFKEEAFTQTSSFLLKPLRTQSIYRLQAVLYHCPQSSFRRYEGKSQVCLREKEEIWIEADSSSQAQAQLKIQLGS